MSITSTPRFDSGQATTATRRRVRALGLHLVVRQLVPPTSPAHDWVEDRLFRLLTGFVEHRSWRKYPVCPSGLDREDLNQETVLRLMESLNSGKLHALHARYVDKALEHQFVNLIRQEQARWNFVPFSVLRQGEELLLEAGSPWRSSGNGKLLNDQSEWLISTLFGLKCWTSHVFRLWLEQVATQDILGRLIRLPDDSRTQLIQEASTDGRMTGESLTLNWSNN